MTSKHTPQKTAAPAALPPRKGLTRAIILVTFLALGFAAWSWHQNSRPGVVHLQNGLDALAANNAALAEQEWLIGTREDPSFPDDYAQIGSLYLSQQRFAEAVTEYQSAAKLSPRDGSLYLQLTRAQLGAHQPVQALEAARRAMALRPDDPNAAGVCGIIAVKLKNRPVALTALRRAHQIKPDDADWTLELARQEMDSLDMAGSERDLATYLKARPDDGEANRLMALLYKQKPPTADNIRASLALAERACRAMPDSPDAFLLLGQLYLSAGEIPEALKAFQTAQARHPSSPEILSGLVTCYSRLHDTALAAQIATVLESLNVQSDRAEHLRTVLSQSSGDIAVRLELARLEEASGDIPAAQDNYAQAARQAPNDPRVRAALVGLRRRHPLGSPTHNGL